MSAAATLESRLAAFDPIALEIRDDGAQHVGHAGAAGGAGHRAILDRVGDLIPYPVHALAIAAYAPDEPRPNERMIR